MKVLFLDFSTRLESVDDLKERARGGMVSSLLRLPDELVRLGHDVFVLSDIPKDTMTEAGTVWCAKDGGCWLKGEDWDILVLNRGIGEGYAGLKAKHRILWTHDLPHAGYIPEPKLANIISATVFMSKYAERVWRTFYPAIKRSFYIPNGVDKELFYPREKIDGYMIYASAPNRGVRRLNYIYDCVRNKVKTPVYLNAYSNMAIMHPNEGPDSAEDWNEIKKEVEFNLFDPLPQEQYAEELGKASLMVLPTRYPEICSNSILQSLASGTPIVTTGNLGSACEWIKDGFNGYLTKFQIHDYMVHTAEMVRLIEKALGNKKLIKNAPKTKGLYTWKQIAKKWNKMFKKL